MQLKQYFNPQNKQYCQWHNKFILESLFCEIGKTLYSLWNSWENKCPRKIHQLKRTFQQKRPTALHIVLLIHDNARLEYPAWLSFKRTTIFRIIDMELRTYLNAFFAWRPASFYRKAWKKILNGGNKFVNHNGRCIITFVIVLD